MNARDFIAKLNNLDINNNANVNQFLETCQSYEDSAKEWANYMQDRYEVNLNKIVKNSFRGDKVKSISEENKILGIIAADFYQQHFLANLDINIDKLSAIAILHPENKTLSLILNAARYCAMAQQSCLIDAEGGIMSVNAHTVFAQNRSNDVRGQAVDQIIMPGIRQITAEYTQNKRYVFFDKAHSGIIKQVEDDMLKLFFAENFLPYIDMNKINNNASNKIYENEQYVQSIMTEYDKYIDKIDTARIQLINEAKEKLGKKADSIFVDRQIENQLRAMKTPEDENLLKSVHELYTSKYNKSMTNLVTNERETFDNASKCFNDLILCLKFLNNHLIQESSKELLGKLNGIFNTLKQHEIPFDISNASEKREKPDIIKY